MDSRIRGNDGGRPPALSLPLPRAFVTLTPRFRHPRECGGLVLILILGFLDSNH